jgi:hypothetical protein
MDVTVKTKAKKYQQKLGKPTFNQPVIFSQNTKLINRDP